MRRSILVASDGSQASMGAMRLAFMLAEQHGAKVEVMGVVEPVPVFDAGFLVAIPEGDLYESRKETLRRELEDEIERVAGSRGHWPIRVEAGLPGPRLVNRAQEVEAGLILLGVGKHRPVDRIFGTETALQVIRLSHIPVMAVPEDCSALPTSVVLGVDFSHFSQRALTAALSVMAVPWEAHLVHVLSGMEFLPTMSEKWRNDYEDELKARLSDLSHDLPVPQGCQLAFHVLEGEPAHEILAFAEDREMELMVAGSHGHSFIGRLLMGSVSTRLVRGARVPILVIPPTDKTQEAFPEEGGMAGEVHPWSKVVDEFSKENVGRRTTMEVDDPELGSQLCGRNFPLRGVGFDPRENRLEIMLGWSGTVDGHLTHSIHDPREIEVVKGEEGVADALRVRLSDGEIRLKIHR